MADAEQLHAALDPLLQAARDVAHASPGSDELLCASARGQRALAHVKALHRSHTSAVEHARSECDGPLAASSDAALTLHGERALERAWYASQTRACQYYSPSLSISDTSVCSLEEVLSNADDATAQRLRNLGENSQDAVLARLRHELNQRISLEHQKTELGKRKREEDHRVRESKRAIERLRPRIASLDKQIKPLADQVSVHQYPSLQQRRSASLLPHPLYTAYCQLSHIESLVYKFMRTSIRGSEQHALGYELRSQASEGDDGHQADKDEYEAHPLSLDVEIFANLTDTEPLVTLSLSYLPRLHLVQAEASKDELGILLVDLCDEGDKGAGNPYTGTALSRPEFVFSLQRRARPYVWAQKLCGLKYVPLQRTSAQKLVSVEKGVQHAHGAEIVKALAARVRSHNKLRRTLDTLRQREMPSVYARSYGGKRVTISSFSELQPQSGCANGWPLNEQQAKAIYEAMPSEAVQSITEEEGNGQDDQGYAMEAEESDELLDYDEDAREGPKRGLSMQSAVQPAIAEIGTRRFEIVLESDGHKGRVRQSVHLKIEARYPNVAPKFTVSLRESNGLSNNEKMSMQQAANEQAVADVNNSSVEGASLAMLEHQFARLAATFEQALSRQIKA